MAISFVGVGSSGIGTGNVTPTLPAGLQEQDFMLLLVETGGDVVGGETITAPAGWDTLSATGPGQGASGQGATRLSLLYRFYQTGDGNPTITDPGDHVISQIAAFRGVDLVSPTTNRLFSSHFNSTTRTTSAVSAIADQWLCVVGVNSLNQQPTITNSAGLTQTQRISLTTTNGDDGALRFYTAPVASAASITGTTTVASSDAILVCAFALNPLPTITASGTVDMSAFSAIGSADQRVMVSGTADISAFTLTASADQRITASATADIGAFSSISTADPLITADATTGMGAFEATGEVTVGDLVPIEVDGLLELVGYGATGWVFVGILEVPGDADYNITVPKLFRVIDIPGIERTATVPGLERTLQVP